jgi:hypothetical protein
MRRNALLLALATTVSAAAPLRAQAVDAMILDQTGRNPVNGAVIVLLDSAGAAIARAQTRPDGRVLLRAPAGGTWRLRATRGSAVLAEGWVEIPAEGTVEVEMRSVGGALAAAQRGDSTITLEPLVAQAAAERRYLGNAGFYDRQRTTSGTFLTGRQFAERGGARMVDRLGGLRGIRIRPTGASGWVLFQTTAGGRCIAGLWVDGRPETPQRLINVRPEDVEGVEVYEPTDVPLRFAPVNRGGRTPCGAVVIWLKTPI